MMAEPLSPLELHDLYQSKTTMAYISAAIQSRYFLNRKMTVEEVLDILEEMVEGCRTEIHRNVLLQMQSIPKTP